MALVKYWTMFVMELHCKYRGFVLFVTKDYYRLHLLEPVKIVFR